MPEIESLIVRMGKFCLLRVLRHKGKFASKVVSLLNKWARKHGDRIRYNIAFDMQPFLVELQYALSLCDICHWAEFIGEPHDDWCSKQREIENAKKCSICQHPLLQGEDHTWCEEQWRLLFIQNA